MRKFTEFEKKTIKKILDLHSKCQTNCAYNVFFDLNGSNDAPSLYNLMPGFDLRYNGKKYILYLDRTKYNPNNFKEIFFGLITDFYEFTFLIDYLVENQYIALATTRQSTAIAHDNYIATDFLSEELQDKLTKYFSCYFYPTNKLYDMVEHDYLDLEGQEKKEEHFKHTMQYVVTTTIALISLVVSLITNIAPIIDKKLNGEKNQKVEILISDENNIKLPVSIDNKDSFIVDINDTVHNDTVHIEEDNSKQIPLDVNVNINYPKTPQDSK